MTLIDLLLLLGAVFWGGPNQSVRLVSEPPYEGALGLACAEPFRAVPGNVQARCPEGYEGIVLYPLALRDVATLLNVLRHESYHLAAGPQEGADPFREREAYAAGCGYSWVAECERWTR